MNYDRAPLYDIFVILTLRFLGTMVQYPGTSTILTS